MKKYGLLFLIGGVFGTLLDGLHTRAGIAAYTNPFIMETAWWVPFLFGAGVLTIGITHHKIHPFPYPLKAFWGSLLFLVLASLITSNLLLPNSVKGALLSLLYLLSWGLWDRTPRSAVLALATASIGCGIESLLGAAGLYYYNTPDFLGIPYWLPFLYLHVSAAAGFLGRVLLVDRLATFR